MKQRNRAVAWLLVILFTTALGASWPAAFAEGDRITLHSAEDFASFARRCKTDTWSQGKTVVLAADIDLSGADCLPVPTFGGTLLGNGYTLSGVDIKTKGSNLGLFRYVQAGAVIENLNVTGSITPDGTKKNIGGIAGVSYGTLQNCSFSGTVTADATVGGICGLVAESGRLIGCRFSGSVTGNSYTGGISGQNYGLIEACENTGSINTTDTETAKSIQDINLDVSKLRTPENIDTATDTGGICGFSKGRVIDCINTGNVGYPAIGYNTGGICGRQAGFLSGCQNRGTINGRKDIGGICGQAEPYILLSYSEDALQQLDGVLEELQSILDYDALSADSRLSDSIDAIDREMSAAADSVSDVSKDAKTYADSMADSVNDAADRLHTALDRSTAAFDSVAAATDTMSQGIDAFRDSGNALKDMLTDLKTMAEAAEKAGEQLSNASYSLENAARRIASACDDLENSAYSLEAGAEKLQTAVRALSKALADKKNIEAAFTELWSSLDTLQKGLSGTASALTDITDALRTLQEKSVITGSISDAIDKAKQLAQCYKAMAAALADIGDAVLTLAGGFDIYSITAAFRMLERGFTSLGNAFSYLRAAGEELETALDAVDSLSEHGTQAINSLRDGLAYIRDGLTDLTAATETLSAAVSELTAGGAPALPVASAIFGNDFDELLNRLRNMQTAFSDVKDIVRDKKNAAADDLEQLSQELRALTDILSGAYEEHVQADADGFVRDISDEDTAGDTRGKIVSSVNEGAVLGDINIGGIVGSMAIEFDFDPEDDIKNSGDKSLSFTYKTKCVVRRCRNEAAVTAKKNYTGGIVGRMDLGSVLSCENYGSVTASDGNYIGGIAGLSDTVIRNSLSKCTLSGTDYIGGIAGQGATLADCRALVNVPAYGECAGSIAGSADTASVKRCYFVSDVLGGIDDISYTGIAEETDINAFVSFAAAAFGTDITFTLLFMADDEEIARVPFRYKDAIPEESIPKVPEKSGYYGKWSSYNFEEATYDAVITAEYYRDIELIESPAKRENGKSVLLVCGAFDDAARVAAVNQAERPEKLRHKTVLDGYAVEISGTYTENYTVRYLPTSEKKNVSLYIESGGKPKKVKAKAFGSYLEFTAPDSSFRLYEVKRSYMGAAVAAVLLVLSAGGLLLFWRRAGKKKGKPNDVDAVQ